MTAQQVLDDHVSRIAQQFPLELEHRYYHGMREEFWITFNLSAPDTWYSYLPSDQRVEISPSFRVSIAGKGIATFDTRDDAVKAIHMLAESLWNTGHRTADYREWVKP